jgi:ribosomal protein S18 acetylase RimI-like enzyme
MEDFIMKIMLAEEYGIEAKTQLSKIFVDAFYQWLQFFSKDKEKLIKAFSHIFNLHVIYVAVIDGKIAGMIACNDGKEFTVSFNKKELKNHLGFFMGSITYIVLRKQFNKTPYPFQITEGMGAVEFVATSADHRGKGVATSIMKYIFDNTSFKEYVLEVADTNTNAVRLYEKLGYKEFMSKKEKHSKRSGIDYLLYMKYLK